MTARPMTEKLEPCPFCGEAVKISPHPVNQWAVCPTEGCIGARQTVVLEDPKQVAAWNRRSTSAAVRGMREALEEIQRAYIEGGNARYMASVARSTLAALSGIEGEDEQARPSGSAPISTDTKGTSK